jgi:hypothetical protein
MSDSTSTQPHGDPAGERLADELRRLLREEAPLPLNLSEAAKAVFTWRTIDAEIASLVLDSLSPHAQDAVLVRSAEFQARLLVLEASDLTIEIQVLPQGERRRLLGQLTLPQPAEITVENAGEVLTGRADELGRFLIEGATPGLMRISVRPAPGGRLVVSRWISI